MSEVPQYTLMAEPYARAVGLAVAISLRQGSGTGGGYLSPHEP